MPKDTGGPLVKCARCGDLKEEAKECKQCKEWAQMMREIGTIESGGPYVPPCRRKGWAGTWKDCEHCQAFEFLAFNEKTGKLEKITAAEYYEGTRQHPTATIEKKRKEKKGKNKPNNERTDQEHGTTAKIKARTKKRRATNKGTK